MSVSRFIVLGLVLIVSSLRILAQKKPQKSSDFGIFTLKKIENSFYKNDPIYQSLKEINQRRGPEKIDSLELFFPKSIGEKHADIIPIDPFSGIRRYVLHKEGPSKTNTYRYFKSLEEKVRGRERDSIYVDYYFTEYEYEYDDGMVISVELRAHNNWNSFLRTSPCLMLGMIEKSAGYWQYTPTGHNTVLAQLRQGIMMKITPSFQKDLRIKEYVKYISNPYGCSGEIVDKVFEQRLIKLLSNFRSKELLKAI